MWTSSWGQSIANYSFADDSNPALCEVLSRRIAESPNQRLTFAEYMELVLYEPQHGYYATRAVDIGPQGDFFTSPHLGVDFGELLAEQFLQMWEILERPIPFTLLELGAGQGLLAADILEYVYHHHPDFWAAIEYIIVERSDALRCEQQRLLEKDKGTRGQGDKGTEEDKGTRGQGDKGTEEDKGRFFLPVRWKTLEEIPVNSIVGCCFSNELVDALPVHQIMVDGGQLQEIYVTAGLVEVVDELSTQRLTEYFDLVGIELPSSAYPSGYRSEVNLAALDWQRAIAERLERGYLVTIDYGYPSTRYYSPAKLRGTLQCYYHHQYHDNPYIHIGRQDITAHVDFTALERWGELWGLHKIGFIQQGLFLMALGLGDRLAALATGTAASSEQGLSFLLQRRDALHQLMNPLGLGGFGVLVQCRGLTKVEQAHPLKGLSGPKS